MRPATPHAQRSWPYIHVVWAVPRSLATTSGVADCFPFLQVLRCFNSLGWLRRPMHSAGDHRGLPGGVAPFGNPRVACFPANRGLSQVATSFIASRCQGIHHTPLLAWPKNLGSPSRRKAKSDDREYSLRHSCEFPQRLPLHSTVKYRVDEARFGLGPRSRVSVRARSPPVVEMIGIEPTASGLQSRRSPS